ncbi:hypothetical protein MFLO_13950 [Listeria floridensis FSL S10-1187]|uniref:Uncharacterized protein n=1 Tax=Listeria floridensis FSL S10-1187 TaxID=1265817 RepID=A0ABP3AUS8_9LIST|nr:hypothetical protein MFLO_13950 [Listeria floridensis FSL S10-1187]
MLCEQCGKKEATTRIQHLLADGTLEEIYLCKECADREEEHKVQAFNELALSFLSMLDGNKSLADKKQQRLTCGTCGLDFETFKKNKSCWLFRLL